MSLQDIPQLDAQKEKLNQELLKIKEFFVLGKETLLSNIQTELDGINSKYNLVIEKSEQSLKIKQDKLKEAEKLYFVIKKEVKEAKETHKKICVAQKEAKLGVEKKKKKMLKELSTDESFKMKTKESEIQYLEKKIKSMKK